MALGAMDPKNSNIITFKLDDFKTKLSHQLDFQLTIKIVGKDICHTILDDGASTSVKYLSCWRSIGSLEVNSSPTTLKSFDEQCFQPYSFLLDLPIELGGKTVSIQVEVVKAPLDYNILLGRNWFYDMTTVASLIFNLLQFPHQGRL